MDAIWTTMEEWGSSVELDYGIFCLIPILVILIIALWKKHTFMSILGGVIIGFLMIAQLNPLSALGLFVDQLYITACDSGNMWVLLVCGLFGSLVALMTESGGALGVHFMGTQAAKLQEKNADRHMDPWYHRICRRLSQLSGCRRRCQASFR